MAQTFTNYNPDQVVVIFANTRIQGFADGTFVSVRPMAAGFTSRAGADRLVSRSRSNDPRVECTMTLMQGSSSNAVLSTIHELDLSAPGGAGVAPLLIQDLNGTTLYECTYAWVTQAPDADEYGKEETDRAWVLEGIKRVRTIAGR